MNSDIVPNFPERVEIAIKSAGGPTIVADKIGVARATLDKWRTGRADPSRQNTVSLASITGLSLNWLATGEGSMRLGEGEIDPEFPSVPRYDAQASCGDGAFIEEAPILDHIPFTQEFLAKKLGRTNTDGLILIDATGDSMAPTINDNALVMIDTRQTQLASAIFAFTYDGALFIKRLNHSPNIIEAICDNKDYTGFPITKEQLELTKIIGKAVWVGQMF